MENKEERLWWIIFFSELSDQQHESRPPLTFVLIIMTGAGEVESSKL